MLNLVALYGLWIFQHFWDLSTLSGSFNTFNIFLHFQGLSTLSRSLTLLRSLRPFGLVYLGKIIGIFCDVDIYQYIIFMKVPNFPVNIVGIFILLFYLWIKRESTIFWVDMSHWTISMTFMTISFVLIDWPSDNFSPESGGRVNPRTAMEEMRRQGTIRL